MANEYRGYSLALEVLTDLSNAYVTAFVYSGAFEILTDIGNPFALNYSFSLEVLHDVGSYPSGFVSILW